MSSCLRPIDQDVRVADQPFRLLGAEYGTRMTVVRLPDSSLWIHSPILAAASMRAELDALGRVEHIVAPNCFHHLTGTRKRPACSRLFRAVIDDREAFYADIERILSWDFDRVILCHGDIIETGGREILRGVFPA